VNENPDKLVKDIVRLKHERGALILAHNYQRPEIQDLADFTGDSLELSRKAAATDAPLIVFCGVTFMAETAKILSPLKTVLIPRPDASCPMADMIDAEALRRLKSEHPAAAVAAYVNSSAEVKALSDVCVTSANAVAVIQGMEAREILFVPDRNLASYVQRFTDKVLIPWPGFCNVHERFTAREAVAAKAAHPGAVLMVHPECRPEVIDLADRVLSTSGMLAFARASDAPAFLVGTEEGILHRLRRENPGKAFHSIGAVKTCVTMKMTRLSDVARSLRENVYAVELPESVMDKARAALEKMLYHA
jgi:quinolinate synthase